MSRASVRQETSVVQQPRQSSSISKEFTGARGAYDEDLATRIREYMEKTSFSEKKMFGGLCFLVFGNMCCGVVRDGLIARVGPDKYLDCLDRNNVKEMNFTGKPMTGMVYVEPEGMAQEKDLESWLDMCIDFVDSLPPK